MVTLITLGQGQRDKSCGFRWLPQGIGPHRVGNGRNRAARRARRAFLRWLWWCGWQG
jgi:hypothetical protein